MRVLVTGGGGFVGRYVVDLLLRRGYDVRSLGRSPQSDLADKGVKVICGDLADPEIVSESCRGVDAVFHVAAKAGVWGAWDSFYQPNVIGSRNVVQACQDCGVERLVYTSTPSVVFNGKSHCGGDETLPYGRDWLCHYAHTKAIAEEETLAQSSDRLKICALRPHLVYGPGDPHLLPRVVESVKAGRLKIVGKGDNRVDVSYVEDVARAHLNAFDALAEGKAMGRAYFISQGEPVPLWPWLNEILEKLGIEPLHQKMPLNVAYSAGALAEGVWKLFRKEGEPPLTRFVAVELAKDHYFKIDAARAELGFSPQVSMADSIDATVSDLLKRGFGSFEHRD